MDTWLTLIQRMIGMTSLNFPKKLRHRWIIVFRKIAGTLLTPVCVFGKFRDIILRISVNHVSIFKNFISYFFVNCILLAGHWPMLNVPRFYSGLVCRLSTYFYLAVDNGQEASSFGKGLDGSGAVPLRTVHPRHRNLQTVTPSIRRRQSLHEVRTLLPLGGHPNPLPFTGLLDSECRPSNFDHMLMVVIIMSTLFVCSWYSCRTSVTSNSTHSRVATSPSSAATSLLLTLL
jgi:hypothetical protein